MSITLYNVKLDYLDTNISPLGTQINMSQLATGETYVNTLTPGKYNNYNNNNKYLANCALIWSL